MKRTREEFTKYIYKHSGFYHFPTHQKEFIPSIDEAKVEAGKTLPPYSAVNLYENTKTFEHWVVQNSLEQDCTVFDRDGQWYKPMMTRETAEAIADRWNREALNA